MSDEIDYWFKSDDIGDIINFNNRDGSIEDERVVMVYCSICGSKFTGTIVGAGKFLLSHEAFHKWEYSIEQNEEMVA